MPGKSEISGERYDFGVISGFRDDFGVWSAILRISGSDGAKGGWIVEIGEQVFSLGDHARDAIVQEAFLGFDEVPASPGFDIGPGVALLAYDYCLCNGHGPAGCAPIPSVRWKPLNVGRFVVIVTA